MTLEGVIVAGCLTLFVVLRRILAAPLKPREHRVATLEVPVYATLAAAPEGVAVRFTGTLRAVGEPRSAPLSGRPCIGSLVGGSVWQSKKTPNLIADLRDSGSVPCALRIGDQDLLIDGGATIACPTTAVQASPDAIRAVLVPHKLERYAEFAELQEGLVVDGDTVTVTGTITQEPAAEQAYRDLAIRMRLVATPKQRLEIRKAKR